MLTAFNYHYPFVGLRVICLIHVHSRGSTALAQQTRISAVTFPELMEQLKGNIFMYNCKNYVRGRFILKRNQGDLVNTGDCKEGLTLKLSEFRSESS